VFLLLALINTLPTRLRRGLPWIGSEPEGGGWLQPARWALRALPQSIRDTLRDAFARGRAAERIAAPIQRWLMLSASQGAAVAFQAGALATTLALVVFSDLSFGWSTTLRIDATSAHHIASVAAAPWAWLWPEAVPSIELIERTRFFRIAARPDPGVSPELYGQWWRFVVAALVCYGLVPRAVFFTVARVRLARGLVRAMRDAPGARRVLARMQNPLVETGARLDADADAARAEVAAASGDETRLPWPEPAVVVSWAEAVEQAPGGTSGLAASGADVLRAGGRLAPSADLDAARHAAARAAHDPRPVAVVVRAFEPPMLEILDFLKELRRQLGDGREIVVGLAHARAEDERVWRRRLASLGDPWLAWSTDVPLGDSERTDATDSSTGEDETHA
jgi:hypothetical protein